MIPSLGHFSLIIAFVLASLQAVAVVTPAGKMKKFLMRLLHQSALLQCFFISMAFACLIISYIESDFSVLNVALNSHSAKPMIFKISASWGNHEGSMILWVWVLAAYGVLLSFANPKLPHLKQLRDMGLGTQGLLQMGFLLFVILTSNPFERLSPVPADGQGLNPLLQDIGLAMHPPLLYAGYVGYGIVFAIGLAALIMGRADREMAKFLKQFIMIPWIFLTLGIGMGSWWAYRELGWGGWWFWDPVENASLLPWLAGTALFHSNIVLAKRGQLGGWVILLSIITFSLSMIGTFLVRSGIVTSVHSFASDPERGVFILAFLCIISGGSLFLFSFKAHKLRCSASERGDEPDPLSPFSREGGIAINNLFLMVATASVLLATIYPMAQELMGARAVTVGAPYYNKTFFPLLAPLMFIGGFSTLLAWKKASLKQIIKYMKYPALATVAAAVISLAYITPATIWLIVGIALGVWVISGTIAGFMRMRNSSSKLSLPQYGMVIAHIGLGIFIFALATSSQLMKDYETKLTIGEKVKLGEYNLTMDSIKFVKENNYIARRAVIRVAHQDGSELTLRPELRIYTVRGSETTEAAIHNGLWQDTYLALRKQVNINGKSDILSKEVRVQLYINPSMLFIWLSMLLIALGGALSLFAKNGLFIKFAH